MTTSSYCKGAILILAAVGLLTRCSDKKEREVVDGVLKSCENGKLYIDGVPLSVLNSKTKSLNLSGVTYDLTHVPAHSSYGAAEAQLYLDFDGGTIASWHIYTNIVVPAFDRDGDATTFNDDEIAAMTTIWERVAEHYSPFNLNVTTVKPADLSKTLTVHIGGDSAFTGSVSGGIAFIGGYNFGNKIAFVFPKNLGNGNTKYTADATAHEAGHSFGLSHQRVFNASGQVTNEYNPGENGFGPIMGYAYFGASVWYKGPTFVPSFIQNDLTTINNSNSFKLRADDFSELLTNRDALVPVNNVISGNGVLEKVDDVDLLPIDIQGPGTTTLKVEIDEAISALDLAMELRNEAGVVLMSATRGANGEATLTSNTLALGRYFVAFKSVSAGSANEQYAGSYSYEFTVPTPTIVVGEEEPQPPVIINNGEVPAPASDSTPPTQDENVASSASNSDFETCPVTE